MPLDISEFSRRYNVRRMYESDADTILALCRKNTQYYAYCGKNPSKELILNDLTITPPGKDFSSKYYVGFYERSELIAVMDLIENYFENGQAFIGFFMTDKDLQGKGIGSSIVQDVFRYLKEQGFHAVYLGIDKGNPQSVHFWKKNGFTVVREVSQEEGTILVAEKNLT